MSRWRRRLEQQPDAPPLLPLWPGPRSNGEFVPSDPTRRDRALYETALRRAEVAAARVGMDRRRFLQTSGGVAAVLSTYDLAACSGGGGGQTAGTTTSTSATSTTGGTFVVPEPEEVEACAEALAGQGEVVVDVHTHHVVPDGPWRQKAERIADMIRGLVPDGCTEGDQYRCLDRTAYLHDMFLASDTAVALLSDVPSSGPDDAPLSFDEKRETRALAESLAGGGGPRVLLHDVIAPNFGPPEAGLAGMEATVATREVAAFKVYTAWGPGGRGFALDDPAIGLPVVEKARELGVKVLCGHKGLPLLELDRARNGPENMVAVASLYPDMDVVVYHAAYEVQTTEGPYDPNPARRGVDSLVRALQARGTAPNGNVWADLGTTARRSRRSWRSGRSRSRRSCRRYGYPALTPEVKRKILGENAARLLGLDLSDPRCQLDRGALAVARAEQASLVSDGELPDPWRPRGPATRRQVLSWLGDLRQPWAP